MILDIVDYGHPALRTKGVRIEKITPEIRRLAGDMLETMYDADGVGLAAQQIGRPVQLCVVDVTDVTDRPSVLRINGEPVDLEAHMPMVLINPEIVPYGKAHKGAEGCLSFPGIRGDIVRPFSVRVKAVSIDGEAMEFEADGLLARAIQHEYDHLVGVLFIDRMEAKLRNELEPEIEQIRSFNSP